MMTLIAARSALTQLFELSQRPHELVQGFAERLQTLAESAYSPAQRAQGVVDLHLVTIFTNGLSDDYIVRRLLRECLALWRKQLK